MAGKSTFDLARDELAGSAPEPLTMRIPGLRYTAARYEVISREEWLSAESDLDLLARACKATFAIDDDNELTPYEDDGTPVGFTPVLAQKLGLGEIKNARQVVLRLFKGNELSVNWHAAEVLAWMRTGEKPAGAIEDPSPGGS